MEAGGDTALGEETAACLYAGGNYLVEKGKLMIQRRKKDS